MKRLALLLALIATPAAAQYQVQQGAVPIGRGAGVTGFSSVLPGADGECLSTSSGKWVSSPCTSSSFVATNSALKSFTGQIAGRAITRNGFSTQGDAPPVVYVYSASACSLNSGSGDDGLQVKPTSGTGCWNANLSSVSTFDVRIWGAVCNGSADIQPFLTTAEAGIFAVYGTGTISIPNNCALGSTYSITHNGISIDGGTRGGTGLKVTFTSGDIISVQTSATIGRWNNVTNLKIICAAAHTSGGTIRVAGADATYINNIQIGDPTIANSGCKDGIVVDNYGNQSATKVLNSTVVNCGGDGLAVGKGAISPASEIFLTNLSVAACQNGLSVYQTFGLYIDTVSVYTSTNVGCAFTPPSGKNVSAVLAVKLICDSSSGDNFYFGDAGNISGLRFSQFFSSSGGGNGIEIAGSGKIDDIDFTDGSVTFNALHGVTVVNALATNLKFNGGCYGFNSTSGSGAYTGMVFPVATKGLQISGLITGKCGLFATLGNTNNQSYGLAFGSSVDNLIVSNVRTPGNVSGGYTGPAATSTIIYSNVINF